MFTVSRIKNLEKEILLLSFFQTSHKQFFLKTFFKYDYYELSKRNINMLPKGKVLGSRRKKIQFPEAGLYITTVQCSHCLNILHSS